MARRIYPQPNGEKQCTSEAVGSTTQKSTHDHKEDSRAPLLNPYSDMMDTAPLAYSGCNKISYRTEKEKLSEQQRNGVKSPGRRIAGLSDKNMMSTREIGQDSNCSPGPSNPQSILGSLNQDFSHIYCERCYLHKVNSNNPTTKTARSGEEYPLYSNLSVPVHLQEGFTEGIYKTYTQLEQITEESSEEDAVDEKNVENNTNPRSFVSPTNKVPAMRRSLSDGDRSNESVRYNRSVSFGGTTIRALPGTARSSRFRCEQRAQTVSHSPKNPYTSCHSCISQAAESEHCASKSIYGGYPTRLSQAVSPGMVLYPVEKPGHSPITSYQTFDELLNERWLHQCKPETETEQDPGWALRTIICRKLRDQLFIELITKLQVFRDVHGKDSTKAVFSALLLDLIPSDFRLRNFHIGRRVAELETFNVLELTEIFSLLWECRKFAGICDGSFLYGLKCVDEGLNLVTEGQDRGYTTVQVLNLSMLVEGAYKVIQPFHNKNLRAPDNDPLMVFRYLNHRQNDMFERMERIQTRYCSKHSTCNCEKGSDDALPANECKVPEQLDLKIAQCFSDINSNRQVLRRLEKVLAEGYIDEGGSGLLGKVKAGLSSILSHIRYTCSEIGLRDDEGYLSKAGTQYRKNLDLPTMVSEFNRLEHWLNSIAVDLFNQDIDCDRNRMVLSLILDWSAEFCQYFHGLRVAVRNHIWQNSNLYCSDRESLRRFVCSLLCDKRAAQDEDYAFLSTISMPNLRQNQMPPHLARCMSSS